MERILIIGSAGSGKSTLSQRLGEQLNLPIIHLDRHYWKPNWIPTPNEEWDQFVIKAADQEQWIMDGNYSRTLNLRLKRADTVIFLDMPTWLCVYRIIKRRIKFHGKTRPDLNEGCPEKLDWVFFKWVWNYKQRSRTSVLDQIMHFKDNKRIIIVKSRQEAKGIMKQFM
ncbi:DNA topology modulation protein [Cohnella hashimotonis]|uniref:DNA topology modulation protein n=1 Tax=Cohnella hashimotonis TaxID=2826895 RepID=A0ABT6TJA2_9BACL|nr:DNA topology modulation protein [Cohnella hashimotonis]MDI4646923.1 DNA topology modulation protein [Cohnella hashimotonis]